MTESTITSAQKLELFARAIVNDAGVALDGPDGRAGITRADIFDVLADLEEMASRVVQLEQQSPYEAAVVADLGAYIAELQQAGEDFDPRLLAILEQREDEDDTEHDPELVALVTNSLQMLGLPTATEQQATALLEVIYRFTVQQSGPGQHAAPEPPQPQTLLQPSPGPPGTPRRPGARLVATPVGAPAAPEPPALSDIARFTATEPTNKGPGPAPVTAADLWGGERGANGRYDAGGL